MWYNGKNMSTRWCVSPASLYTESSGNGVMAKVQGHTLSLFSSLSFCPPPTYFISITVYFNLFTLVTQIANSGQFVLVPDKSVSLSGHQISHIWKEAWEQMVANLPLSLLTLCVRISIPQTPLPWELWLSRIQGGDSFALYSASHGSGFLTGSFHLCSNGQKRNAVVYL